MTSSRDTNDEKAQDKGHSFQADGTPEGSQSSAPHTTAETEQEKKGQDRGRGGQGGRTGLSRRTTPPSTDSVSGSTPPAATAAQARHPAPRNNPPPMVVSGGSPGVATPHVVQRINPRTGTGEGLVVHEVLSPVLQELHRIDHRGGGAREGEVVNLITMVEQLDIPNVAAFTDDGAGGFVIGEAQLAGPNPDGDPDDEDEGEVEGMTAADFENLQTRLDAAVGEKEGSEAEAEKLRERIKELEETVSTLEELMDEGNGSKSTTTPLVEPSPTPGSRPAANQANQVTQPVDTGATAP